MHELIKATKATRHVLNIGKDTLYFARQMKKADNKTRLKTTGKLLGLITLGLSKWFVRETWYTACRKPIFERRWNPYTEQYENEIIGFTKDREMVAIGNIFSACGRKVRRHFVNKFNEK